MLPTLRRFTEFGNKPDVRLSAGQVGRSEDVRCKERLVQFGLSKWHFAVERGESVMQGLVALR